MNTVIKTMLIALVLMVFNAESAHARKRGVGFFSIGGESISKVADFPDEEDYQIGDGSNFDAGCIYKQTSILFIPVWNYDLKWCGYVEDAAGEVGYVELTKEELDIFAEAAGVTLPAEPTISFWDKIGGKLVFLLIIVAFIAYSILSPDEDEEEVKTEDSEPKA